VSAGKGRASGAAATLVAAIDWRIGFPFVPNTPLPDQAVLALARCVGAQLRAVERAAGRLADDCVVCTTNLTPLVVGDPVLSTRFLDGIGRSCGLRPATILASYECAGWGYALRFYAQHTAARQVLVTIVDVDLHNYSTLTSDMYWGRSGYGVTTLLLELPIGEPLSIATGWAPHTRTGWGNHIRAFANLSHAIKIRQLGGERHFVSAPFLPPEVRQTLERVVGADRLFPNRLGTYGHCFGSDPWIGVIEWVTGTPPTRGEKVIVASLAHNGYHTMCDVQVSPDTTVDLKRFSGDDETIDLVVNGYGKMCGETIRAPAA
jgi:hypothetical protein